VARELGGEVGFRHAATGRRILAQLTGDIPHRGGQALLHEVDVALHRGQRVRIAGVNGAGKSTLLAALLDTLTPTTERIALLPQELPDPVAAVAELAEMDPDHRGRVLGTLATLGVNPDQLLVTAQPSPGEARKLTLARLLSSSASLLVLDEPTNHLDLPSIERLEAALRHWPGSLLLVTHDDMLAEAVTDTTWTIANGTVRVPSGEGLRP